VGKIRILIVEDERIIAEDIKNTLHNIGYEVCGIVSKGEDAVEKASIEKPDLILMDIMLSGYMNGVEAAHTIYKNQQIPVVFLSAFADVQIVEAVKESEPFGYIIKPFTDRELYSAIEIALKKSLLLKKISHLNNVLQAIRNVNKLIVREKEKKQLLKGVCDNFIETRGYHNVWIALFDKSGNCEYIEHAGIEGGTNLLFEYLKKGNTINCISSAIATPGVLIINNPLVECKNCPLSDKYNNRKGLTIAIKHNDIFYGVLTVSIQPEFADNKEEFSLLEEVVGDIAYALYNLEIEANKEKTNRELKETESRYKILIEQSADAIYLLYEGKFEIVNAKFTEMFGYSIEETNSHDFNFIRLVSQRSLPIIEERVELAKKGVQLKPTYEFVAVSKYGQEIDCEVSVTYIKYKNGTATQGIIRDISERKKAEKRQILISEILAIVNRQNEWKKLIGDILIKLKNYTGFEAIGIRLKEGDDYPFYETLGFHEDFVKMGNSLFERSDIGEVILDNSGKPLLRCMCGSIISCRTDPTLPFYTQRGSFWTNSIIKLLEETPKIHLQLYPQNPCCIKGYESVALIPLHSGDEVIGLLQFNDKQKDMIDLSMVHFFEEIGATIGIAFKRMQTEKKIIESEERFRNIYENSTVGLYQSNFDGKLIMANPAIITMFGYSGYSEFIKMNTKDLYVDPKEQELFYRILREEGTIYGFEETMIKKDGRKIVVMESARLIKDKNGNELYIEGVVEDITERKRFEVELIEARNQAQASNRVKTEFLAQMSHEVRTPVNAILNFVQLIEDEVSRFLDQETLSYFGMVNSSSARIIRTIDLILNMSQLQTGSYETIFKSIDIYDDVLVNLKKEYEHVAKRKGLQFFISMDGEPSKITADEYSVTQILTNLIDNAIKYTEEGKVEVNVKRTKNKRLKITVEDTGVGISKEYLPKLFEEFSQEEHGYTRTYEGNGLGLALVKKYCEINDAEIFVKSEKGKGSKFTVIFKI